MAEKSSAQSGGIGGLTILFFIFLTLKLAEIGPVQYWSWWWIFAPVWMPLAAVLIVVILLHLFVR